MLIAFNKPFNVLCQFTDRSVPPRPTLAGFGLPPRVRMPRAGWTMTARACCC